MPQQLSALCLYDRRRFAADTVRHAIRIHPHLVTASRMFVTNDGYSLRDASADGTFGD
jgi:hypothetical protein